jgi:hypothetical protein
MPPPPVLAPSTAPAALFSRLPSPSPTSTTATGGRVPSESQGALRSSPYSITRPDRKRKPSVKAEGGEERSLPRGGHRKGHRVCGGGPTGAPNRALEFGSNSGAQRNSTAPLPSRDNLTASSPQLIDL